MTLDTETTLIGIQNSIMRRLDTISGLRATATEVDRPDFPAAYPRLVSWIYDTVFEGHADWTFDIWVMVSIAPDLNRAQVALNEYLAPAGRKSIKCAIDADPSLGGCVSFARVLGGGDYGRVDIGGIAALGASVRVLVSA